MQIDREENPLSCGLFPTYRNGEPIGTQELPLTDKDSRGCKASCGIKIDLPAM